MRPLAKAQLFQTVVQADLVPGHAVLKVATKENLVLGAPSLFIAIPADVFDEALAHSPTESAFGPVKINTAVLRAMDPAIKTEIDFLSNNPANELRQLVGTASDLSFVAVESDSAVEATA